jgi:signal transduction histidine kinase
VAPTQIQLLRLQLVVARETDHDLIEILDSIGEELRTVPADDRDARWIAERLVDFAEHSNWEVRKSVAHALLHVRGDEFHAALARLLHDENAWVRNAALRTKTRRSEISRSGLLKDEQATMVLRRLSDLEAQHGVQARQAVMREIDWNTELVMRGVYHELVKPIDTLMTALEAADIEARREKVSNAMLARISTARDRVTFLNATLVSLRDQMRDVAPEYTTENLLNLIEELFNLLADRMQARRGSRARGQHIVFDVDPTITVEVHRHCLMAAFLNIVQNAYESYDGLRRPLSIWVSAVVDRSNVIIQFADRGCGMSEEGVAQAFRLFTTSKPNGTGFGLPYAKKMVEGLHHGSIRLESKLGTGTAVIVTLPVEQEHTTDVG